MTGRTWRMCFAIVLGGSALVATTGWSGEETEVDELPDNVETSFTKLFPKAVITEMSREDEGGIIVYDIEFTEDNTDRSAEVSVDGVVLEVSTIIDAESVPAAAMKAVMNVAKGAAIQEIERVEVGYEFEGGQLVKLSASRMQYEVEMARGEQWATLTVATDGTVLEPAAWHEARGDDDDDEGDEG